MLCKVISTKSVFGNKADIQKLVLDNQKEPQFLYRVWGVMTGYVTGQSKFTRTDPETGEVSNVEWTKFAGDFAAANNRGQLFESAICFIPDYVSGPLRQGLESEQGTEVQFGFDIFAVYSEKSATSYEFVAQPLRDNSVENRLTAMANNMPALPNGAKLPALENKKQK